MADAVSTGQHRPNNDCLRPAVMTRLRSPQILAFMTPFPYSIDIEAPLGEAHAFLRERQIRHLPVTRGGKLVGIFTTTDACRALARVLHGQHPHAGPDQIA